ncbi:MAG TPA: D-2-hydroxyacid dehydrogenase [Bryobacteraceae bacterium]|nr:D-2-hydroxyacid dehydrogenase [Bryobacteraceae bacterium]
MASEQSLLVIAPPDASWLQPLVESGIRHVVAREDKALIAAAPSARVVLNCTGAGAPLRTIWQHAGKLEWVHSLAAGVENQLIPELVESGIPLTNSRGVYASSLAEFALAAILYYAKDLQRMKRQQKAHRWEQFDVEMIEGRTVGIVGYGAIGRQVAERVAKAGMKVYGLRRRPDAGDPDPNVARMYGTEALHELLPQCDYVVITAALTPQTRGMIGAAELGLLPPHCVLINLGRGPVIQEQALIATLSAGRIRGAALDVFEVEPLPEDHPLWDFENVLISPHCADHIAGWLESAVQFFVENYRRFDAGQPLQNVVDKRAGY